MYLLVVYNDFEKKEICFIGEFLYIKDITTFTNGYIKYADRRKSKKCYKTYKSLFSIIKTNKSLIV